MSVYSKALRHVDNKDFKRTYQRRLDEQKVLCKIEEEKKREQLKELKEIQKLSSALKYNWREKLNEGMTSSGVFFSSLPATGDTNLEYPNWNIFDGQGYSVSGGSVTISGGEQENGIIASFDTSEYDTVVFDVSANNTVLGIFGGGENLLLVVTSPGTYSINTLSNPNLLFLLAPGSGTTIIDNLRYQRRTPMNVFIPLDDPRASAFIRTSPFMSNLSPQERLEKLKDMLEASNEYVIKSLGSDFPGGSATPLGEYDPFAQVPPGEAGDTPGVEIAGLPPGMYPIDPLGGQAPAPRGYKAPGTYDPKQFYPLGPNTLPSPNLPSTGPGLSQSGQDTQVAQGWTDDPSTWPSIKNPVKTPPAIIDPKTGWPSVPNVPPSYRGKPGGQQVRMAHYEPQGQLISEKRKLKSPEEILNRIPGYYDGKPAPLGFPETPPPEMVNGMHPDLVDGKNVANRFNRLDPQSAKAMPLTGNPHIDKKVLKARKQPK